MFDIPGTSCNQHLGTPMTQQFFSAKKKFLEMIKTLVTFHYTGYLIGILITAYYNPHVTG